MLESAAVESFDPNDASVGDMTVSTDIIRLLQLFAQFAVIIAIVSDIPAAGQQLQQTTQDVRNRRRLIMQSGKPLTGRSDFA
jgi:hypothetical protein